MKLTDDERKWVEGQNRYWDDIQQEFYIDETVAKLLESEQAAWREVDRLREENNILESRAHHLECESRLFEQENERLKSQLTIAAVALENIFEFGNSSDVRIAEQALIRINKVVTE